VHSHIIGKLGCCIFIPSLEAHNLQAPESSSVITGSEMPQMQATEALVPSVLLLVVVATEATAVPPTHCLRLRKCLMKRHGDNHGVVHRSEQNTALSNCHSLRDFSSQ